MQRAIQIIGLILIITFIASTGIAYQPVQTVNAQDGTTGNTVTVATGAANIRSGPSLSTTILGIVYAGEVLSVSGQSGGGWWRVETVYGTGWISGRITIFRGDRNSVPLTSEPAGISAPSTVVAANGPVRVYSTPNADSFVITIIPTGGSADIIGRTPDGAWLQVATPAGTGFVPYSSIAQRGPLDEVPVVSDPGPSFRGPTVQINSDQAIINDAGANIGSLAAGTTLPIIGRNGDNTRWMVASNTGVGWINVTNVSIAGSVTEVPLRSLDAIAGPPPDNDVHASATIIVQRKIFYANTDYVVPMLDAGYGTEVGIIGRSEDGLWLRVIIQGNVVWMVFAGITFNGDMTAIPVLDTSNRSRNHVVVNAFELNVRSGPGAQYTILTTFRGGDTIHTTGVSPDRVWWRVEGDFGVGWVRTRYILFRGDVNTIPVVTEPMGEVAPNTVVMRRTAFVYSVPNPLEANIVGSLAINTEHVITGRNPEWTMYQLQTELGLVWVRIENIYFRGFADQVPIIRDTPVTPAP